MAAFSSPAATLAALGLPIVIFLPPLYAELGLSLTLVGSIFMLTRFFDVATDPIFGVLGDRINTRWGRRRPALLISVPILMYGVYRVFFPPEAPDASDLLISLLVLYVGWTMFTLAHTAWASELSTDYDVRSRIMGTIHFFSLAGLIAVMLLPVVLDQLSVDATMRDRTALMGWFVLLTLPLLTGAATMSTGEPDRGQQTPIAWREAVSSLLGNRPLRRLLAADLLLGIQAGINSSVHFFFVGHVLALPEYGSLYLLVLFISGLLCVPLFLRLSYRLGKHQTLAVAVLVTSIGTLAFFVVPQHSFWITFIVYVLVGVNVGAKDFLMRSIMADVIDQDRVTTGTDRSALYYSMLTLTAKVGLAASVGLIYPMLDWVGFDPTGVNDDATLSGVRVLAATSPTLLLFLVFAIMWRFPLDKSSQQDLRAQLEADRG
ncbi:MAG: MFS transporter [Pseudomonadales bacterium]